MIFEIVGTVFLLWFVVWVPVVIGSWLTILVVMSLLAAATGKTHEQLFSADQPDFIRWITLQPLWQLIRDLGVSVFFFSRQFFNSVTM